MTTVEYVVLDAFRKLILENNKLRKYYDGGKICDLSKEINSAFRGIKIKAIEICPDEYKAFFKVAGYGEIKSILVNNDILVMSKNGPLLNNSMLQFFLE